MKYLRFVVEYFLQSKKRMAIGAALYAALLAVIVEIQDWLYSLPGHP